MAPFAPSSIPFINGWVGMVLMYQLAWFLSQLAAAVHVWLAQQTRLIGGKTDIVMMLNGVAGLSIEPLMPSPLPLESIWSIVSKLIFFIDDYAHSSIF